MMKRLRGGFGGGIEGIQGSGFRVQGSGNTGLRFTVYGLWGGFFGRRVAYEFLGAAGCGAAFSSAKGLYEFGGQRGVGLPFHPPRGFT